MVIKDIIELSGKPEIYTPGDAFMWTDPHISEELLKLHLNEDIDLASRKKSTIDITVEWILGNAPSGKLNILDLGCGPGLYTERYAQKGHSVTGVDISERSIKHAVIQSRVKKQKIDYINASYLDISFPEKFDLVTMIYTDFGVLSPADRNKLLETVYKALKPGGVFIFDVLSDKDIKQKVPLKNWEVSPGGFWKAGPYIAFSEAYLYENEKVMLMQHIVASAGSWTKAYRFWTHFFNPSDLSAILGDHNFRNPEFFTDVIPAADQWSGDNVIFCKTKK